MARLWNRLRWPFSLALLALAVAWSFTAAQPPHKHNERDVKPQPNIQDKDDVWVLEFRFKDPRLISVDVPGRGRRLIWYMWYQVINNTGSPQRFIPDFELVTLDKPGVYNDEVLPKAQEAISRLEDPTGHLEIKNSVTITSQPIPVSKPDAFPKAVTGVAIWDNVNPEATRFSIFVTGLSNGMSLVDGPDNKEIRRRKTLQLNFKRVGDRLNPDSRDFKFVSSEWVYRASSESKKEKPAEIDKPR